MNKGFRLKFVTNRSVGNGWLGFSFLLGGKVNFISKIGKVAYGKLALETLKKNNNNTENIIQYYKLQTYLARILVDKRSGNNAINVIVGAANSLKNSEMNNQMNLIKHSKIFLTLF